MVFIFSKNMLKLQQKYNKNIEICVANGDFLKENEINAMSGTSGIMMKTA